MSFEYLAYDLSRGDEEVSALTVDRRLPRDVDNPFHLNATEFKKLYRLTLDLAEYLIYQLSNQIRGSGISAISTEKQVLAALRFFATGCYQRPVGENWGISMSQSSKVKFPMTQAAKEMLGSASSPFVGGTIGAVRIFFGVELMTILKKHSEESPKFCYNGTLQYI